MSLPTFEQAMEGFTTEGLTSDEALRKRKFEWNWAKGAALVGPHLDGNDLAACCLVSRGFNKGFLPILWSNPIKILKSKGKRFRKCRCHLYV